MQSDVANRYESPDEFARRCKVTLAMFKSRHAARLLAQQVPPQEVMRRTGYARKDTMMTAIERYAPLCAREG